MLALPDVIDGGGVKAVAGVKFAAAVPAFKFFGILGIFFDFDIDDNARVWVLPADGLQNLRTVPAAAQFWNDCEIDDVRDAPVRDGVRGFFRAFISWRSYKVRKEDYIRATEMFERYGVKKSILYNMQLEPCSQEVAKQLAEDFGVELEEISD